MKNGKRRPHIELTSESIATDLKLLAIKTNTPIKVLATEAITDYLKKQKLTKNTKQ